MAVEEIPADDPDGWVEPGWEEVGSDGEYYTPEQVDAFWEEPEDPGGGEAGGG